jgi:hypothetical protein
VRTCIYRPQSTVYAVSDLSPMVYGLTYALQGEVGLQMADSLRQLSIFGSDQTGASRITFGPNSDLAATNIQRGRDVGLPTYNAVRAYFNLPVAAAWSDITADATVQGLLASLYPSIDDCDLWVCGLAEPHEVGANVGATFKAIIKDQFLRWRDGDRFWYENPDQFTAQEIVDIHSTTLGDIIARNMPGMRARSHLLFSALFFLSLMLMSCVVLCLSSTHTEAHNLPQNLFFTPTRQLLSSTYTPLVVDASDIEYEHSRLLHPIYLLSWTVSGNQINFRVKVRNQGWVGLGFDNDAGSMKNGDIVFMARYADGSFVIEDRFALDVGNPARDADLTTSYQAQCKDDLFAKSAQLGADGVTTFRWSRLIDTGDTYCDHPFHTGATKIMFAFNPSTTSPAYHGPTRNAQQTVDLFASRLKEDSRPLQVAVVVTSSVTIGLAGVLIGLLVCYRTAPAVVHSTYLFCLLICVGAVCGYISVILETVSPTTLLCQTKFGLLSVAYVLVYGSILIKTFRIHLIFNGTSIKRIVVTTPQLALAVLVWLCLELGLVFGIWHGVDPLKSAVVTVGDTSTTNGQGLEVCRASNETGMLVWIVYKV